MNLKPALDEINAAIAKHTLEIDKLAAARKTLMDLQGVAEEKPISSAKSQRERWAEQKRKQRAKAKRAAKPTDPKKK